MAKQVSRNCRFCQRPTLHHKAELMPQWLHAVLILLTCGLWLLVALPMVLLDMFQPARCQVCGGKT